MANMVMLQDLITKIKDLKLPCILNFESHVHQDSGFTYYSARIISEPRNTFAMPFCSYHSSLEEAKIAAALYFYLQNKNVTWYHRKILSIYCKDKHVIQEKLESRSSRLKDPEYTPGDIEEICNNLGTPEYYKVDFSSGEPCQPVVRCESFD